jgi:DNA-binding IscR family transcriptional regulator
MEKMNLEEGRKGKMTYSKIQVLDLLNALAEEVQAVREKVAKTENALESVDAIEDIINDFWAEVKNEKNNLLQSIVLEDKL